MPHFLAHVLASLQKYSARTLLKLFSGTPDLPSWTNISYHQFEKDMEKFAMQWLQPLQEAGLSQKDVIGLWVTGHKYNDLVSMYGMARLGYVPQMLNKSMATQGQQVVEDVLAATKAKAVLYDPFFADLVTDFTYACFELVDVASIQSLPSCFLPGLPVVEDDDLAVVFHTSGTTSGKPKPIPETHKWMRCQAQIQWTACWQGGNEQGVVNNLGSFANVGSATMISHLGWLGQCMIQASKPDFEEHKFMAMIENGLNFVFLYAPWLSKLINVARTDVKIFTALQNMRQVIYTGAALNPEDEQWLIKNGINATVLYATTESGICLISDLHGEKPLPSMHLIDGMKCQLIPTCGVNTSELDDDSEKRSGSGQLYDCFIPADADNCPHPSIRNRPNGHITGDLFEETSSGFYAFRGRNDDWIRTGKFQSFCDTKSIEDNILQNCGDFVQNCIVVGHYKPGVVLLAEPLLADPADEEVMSDVKQKILERHTPFNSRLFAHERIDTVWQILTVPRGTLPRTMEKGNIRRKATEDQHAETLAKIYAKLKTW